MPLRQPWNSRGRGPLEPIKDMVGGGPFGLKAGEWTDDTAMSLCLAESLIKRKGFDPAHKMKRYLKWFREGYLSSNGRCFDIGNTVRDALVRFERTGESLSGSTNPYSVGNGSIMRLAPVPMYFAGNPLETIEKSGESFRTTHGATVAVDACRYLGALILGALRGERKEVLLCDHYSPVAGYWKKKPLSKEIAEIASGSFKKKKSPGDPGDRICGQIPGSRSLGFLSQRILRRRMFNGRKSRR